MEQSFKSYCGTSALNVSLAENPDDNLVDVALWRRGNGEGAGVFSRIKLALYVLWKGHAYTDMLSFNPEDAVRFGHSVTQLGEIAVFRKSERQKVSREKAMATLSSEETSPPTPPS